LLETDPQLTARKLTKRAAQKIPGDGKTFMEVLLPTPPFSLMFAGFRAMAPNHELNAKK